MTESVQSCFELSMHFPVFFPREVFSEAVHGWFAIQGNVWKVPPFVLRASFSDLHRNLMNDMFSS